MLPFLHKPTLIMMGDADAIVPLANGRILHTLIPGSELEVFAGGGHLFLLSHREQSVRCIRAFLDREEQRKAA
jgi:pimeloyl-ACP methyl ester carboxylesterase